jgi:hypothetical protein
VALHIPSTLPPKLQYQPAAPQSGLHNPLTVSLAPAAAARRPSGDAPAGTPEYHSHADCRCQLCCTAALDSAECSLQPRCHIWGASEALPLA